MIIVEGVDNTGKTTLIDMLKTIFPMLQIAKMDNAPHATEEEYREYLWDQLAKTPRQSFMKLYDRLLFSEIVYGPILRGKSRIKGNELRAAMHLLLYYHEPLIIYCDRTEEQIKATFGEREQLEGVYQHIPALLQQYSMWLNPFLDKRRTRAMVVRYDYENSKSSLKVVGAVADRIRRHYNIVANDWEEVGE